MSSVLDRITNKFAYSKKHIRTDAYRFQLGFDFGTSYSKCVYRDLGRARAHVFTFDCGGKNEYLISSTVIYKDDFFLLNKGNKQYPENGLWHIKMALADIVQKNYNSTALDCIKRNFNFISINQEMMEFIKSACYFYLTQTLYNIRSSIVSHYPDFGKNEKDDMYVTMAIPVSNIQDSDTKNIFLEILKKAWFSACHVKNLSPKIPRSKIRDVLKRINVNQVDGCYVYPEVSANIQPFRVSSQSPGDSSRIYLVTDVGSGTVDQCCFTLTNRKEIGERINYFSAQVFSIGSSTIEHRCTDKGYGNIDQWRKKKEKNELDSTLNDVIKDITIEIKNDMLNKDSTLAQLFSNIKEVHTHKHIYGSNLMLNTIYNETKDDVIRRLLYLIFTGGGDMYVPYRQGVINALESKFNYPNDNKNTNSKLTWADRVISISTPEDIDLPKGCEDWMKRLYVAYGLSFKYEELPSEWFPVKEVRGLADIREEQLCPFCRGKNPQCYHCNGFG